SAAYYFRKHAGSKAKILVLDNHDDFGGHAKRNEFSINGRTLLGYGGTFSIDSPAPYNSLAKGFIQEIWVDVGRWKDGSDFGIYVSQGLKPAVFFDKENFRSDRLVQFPLRGFWADSDDPSGKDPNNWKQFLAEAPISEKAKHDLLKLYTNSPNYMPRLTSE